MAHTPGPWRAEGPFDADEVWYGGGFYKIGGPSGCYLSAGYEDASTPRANAALIAAAPELLDVALAYEQWEADVLECADWSFSTPRLTQSQCDRLVEIQTMRNAAIAKARGE